MSTDTREALAALVAAHDALQARSWPGGPAQYEQQRDELRAAWANARAALATQPAQPRTLLEQFDLDQSPDYRKGYEDGRLKGYEVGHRHATEHAKAGQPSAQGEAGWISPATVLPDGSAFAVASFPPPKDHWLYAPRGEWDNERDDYAETPRPILTNAQRDAVIAAARYAIRGATMCGQEPDFDPDAMALNFAYAMCGPARGKVLPADASAPAAPAQAVPLTDYEIAQMMNARSLQDGNDDSPWWLLFARDVERRASGIKAAP